MKNFGARYVLLSDVNLEFFLINNQNNYFLRAKEYNFINKQATVYQKKSKIIIDKMSVNDIITISGKKVMSSKNSLNSWIIINGSIVGEKSF